MQRVSVEVNVHQSVSRGQWNQTGRENAKYKCDNEQV